MSTAAQLQAQKVTESDPVADPLIRYWERSVRLTDAQKNALHEISSKLRKEENDAMQQSAQKRRSAADALADAEKARDQRALAKAREALMAASKPALEIQARYHNKLQNVLTPEQKKEVEKNQVTLVIEDKTEPVKLSPQQISRVKARFSETEKAQGRDAAMMKLSDLVLPVLTRQQKTAIVSGRAARVSKELLERAGATPEQIERAKPLVDEIAKAADFDKLWPYPENELTVKLFARIRDILTPEQKVKLGGISSSGNFQRVGP